VSTQHSTPPLDARARRNHRIAVWCGMLFLGIPLGWGILGSFLTPPLSPSATPEDVTAFVTAGGVLQKFGLMIALACTASLLPMSAVLGDQMRRMEGARPVWAQTQLACATLTVWLLSAALVFFAAAAFRADRDPQLILLLHDLGWLTVITPVSMIVLWMAAVGGAILSDRSQPPVMPRWVGYLSIWAALLSAPGFAAILFHSGPFAWSGLLALWIPLVIFLVWWITLTVYLLKAIGKEADASVA
jgi:MFS family permease